jgi:uncharacterized YccA/Bax inhibitor family protein
MSNPTMRADTWQAAPDQSRQMTVNGTIHKLAIVAVLVMATFVVGWQMTGTSEPAPNALGLVVGASVLGMILSLVISFKQTLAPVLTPVFALIEGFVLGGFSAMMEASYEGIVAQAALGTFGVFTGLLVLYRTRILKIGERFVAVTQLAMWSVFFIYLASFLMSLGGITFPYIHESSPIGIAFSVLVIIVASMMLLSDFHFIEEGERRGAAKSMEWYGAFALLVSIVWLYVEMLRLLAKMRR